ncbi:MAG TPA: hypothetical protein VNX46_12735 [Candidatus Acidoferrum sp.]|jgi:hypothetical protein|nr:hypothetical protein [Candidatus Acidoferrum sp.]
MADYQVIQVIPLCSNVNEEAVSYFRDHKGEIEAITGAHVIVAVPASVTMGDADDVYSASDSKRYQGLKLDQLPCLWVESKEGSIIVPLPSHKEQINKLLLHITQAAKETATWEEFKKKFEESKKQQQAAKLGDLTLNPYDILKDAIVQVPAMRYALGVLGLVAVIAIVKAWQINFVVAIFGSLIILALMIILAFFANVMVQQRKKSDRDIVYFMSVFFVCVFGLLITLAATFFLTASAFKWPPAFYELLFKQHDKPGGTAGTQSWYDAKSKAVRSLHNLIEAGFGNPGSCWTNFTSVAQAAENSWRGQQLMNHYPSDNKGRDPTEYTKGMLTLRNNNAVFKATFATDARYGGLPYFQQLLTDTTDLQEALSGLGQRSDFPSVKRKSNDDYLNEIAQLRRKCELVIDAMNDGNPPDLDAKLGELVGTDQVDGFQLVQVLKQHLDSL